jgi:hypothetical protein
MQSHLNTEGVIPKAHATAVVVSKSDEEAWELPRPSVKLGKQLGSGNYGEVWKATYDKKVRSLVLNRGFAQLPRFVAMRALLGLKRCM